jgi:hypothetical protein
LQDKKLVRRIDFWLIPWLCLLYLLSFLGKPHSFALRIDDIWMLTEMRANEYRQIAQTSATLVSLDLRPTCAWAATITTPR